MYVCVLRTYLRGTFKICRYNILNNRIRLYMSGAYISIVNKALIDILCIYVSRTLIRYVPRTYV